MSIGFTGKQTEQIVVSLSGSLPVELLLQLKWSVTRVLDVLARGAGQTGIGRLHQRHFTGHWLHPHLTPRREVHRPMHPERSMKVKDKAHWLFALFQALQASKKSLSSALSLSLCSSRNINNNHWRLPAMVLIFKDFHLTKTELLTVKFYTITSLLFLSKGH